MLVWATAAVTYTDILHFFIVGKPEGLALLGSTIYIPAFLALGYATLRLSSMAFWKNIFVTILLTFLSSFGVGFFGQFIHQ